MNKKLKILALLLAFVLSFTSCTGGKELYKSENFGDSVSVVLNENIPEFTKDEITDKSFETYSELDSLGRCGVAFACIGKDLMPTEERGAIGQVKPSGWQLAKYDCVDGKYLYNRCHLIGYQLTGENANERNLITGTRSMNVDGMLPFENEVAEYIEKTDNHVMYRVTPVFDGENLLASGVQMEALSVEDGGKGVSFNVFVYNTQPGISINYADGTSREDAEPAPGKSENSGKKGEYVLNTNTKKIHRKTCRATEDIQEKNKQEYVGSKEELKNKGYAECGICKP